MTLSSTLANAVSGLNAAQTALATTAANVANVNTPGYSRKVVQQENRLLAGQGAGVRSLDVGRIVDQFLGTEARAQATRLGRTSALADVQQRIQDTVFGAPGDAGRDIHTKLASLLTSLDALAATPEQAAARIEVVNQIAEVLRGLDAGMRAVQSIRADADHAIGEEIGAINAGLAELADINLQLARGNGGANLQDRRDQILAGLAGRIDLQVGWQDNGQLTLTTRTGIVLLDGPPRQVVYQPASSAAPEGTFGRIGVYQRTDIDPTTGQPRPGARSDELVSAGARARLTPELVAAGAAPIVSSLRGGTLQGLVEARDRTLPELADQLSELGDLLRFTLNAAHNGSVSLPPPNSLTGTRAGQAAGDPFAGTGQATFALVDRGSGATAGVFRIDLSTLASVGDVQAAITAASAGSVVASLDPEGRLVLASADPTLGLALAEGDSAIAGSDAAGHARTFGFSHFFGLNDLVVGADSGRAGSVRPDIAADPFGLASARLDVDAAPPLAATLGGKGDARGAAALSSALRTPSMTVARGGLPAYATTPLGYAADITSLSASLAAEAGRARDADQALASDLESRISGLSGVSLDEEMSRLILYQQAYAVSARIISITDDLFGELLQIAR
ncbi:flagellar hook-associated protein FlgK [Geminicoccus roseus]|uniref:flagellar hook-associated protein FlgK n=1 Tax=Geminicoccus roseus TaxID=404900 RepID=UPI0003F87BCA|nr:flagellar basal body protein [Geminicoccus roseus]